LNYPESQVEPYLKYAGRKFKHPAPLPALFAPYRDTHTWVEPFVGACGATFWVQPRKAFLNDSSPFLINLHQWVKKVGLPTDTSIFINEKEVYYKNRSRFNELAAKYPGYLQLMGAADQEKEELALLTYYLNRAGFNGLTRFSQKKRKFNTPFGRNKIKWCIDFTTQKQLMSEWIFYCTEWWDSLDYLEGVGATPKEKLFVYADPPFDGGKTSFTGYTGQGFDWDEQVKLCETLSRISHPVVASNLVTERILELYKDNGFSLWTFPVKRSISCKGAERKPVLEVLAIKGMDLAECGGLMENVEGCEFVG
jgi:DNA adenine methylase